MIKIKQVGLNGDVFASIQQAYPKAKNATSTNDLIFVGGSIFIVAEVI
jgi:dihydrofolate synthase/folylpolyglutamate synthase